MSRYQLAFVVLLFAAAPVLANGPEFEWLRKGYILVHTESGEFVSRHLEREKAYQSAIAHAYASGNTGELLYEFSFPNRVMIITMQPEIVPPTEPPPEPPPPPPPDPGDMLEEGTVFVCNESGANGATVEPAGKPGNDGFSAESPLPDLSTTRGFSAGTDVRFCEGMERRNSMLRIAHSGDPGDGNRAVIAMYQQGMISRLAYQMSFKVSDVNQAVIGCYQILNGVARPCWDTIPVCAEDKGVKECFEPS